MNDHEAFKHIGDALSVSVVVATLVQWLPAAAAFVSLLWGIGRLIEMWTGKTISQLRKGE